MKARTREARKPKPQSPSEAARPRWPWVLGLFVALVAVLEVYGPVLRGPFLFDDDYLPFRAPNFPAALKMWTVGVRPLLMFSYWINYRISPDNTLWYHLFNVAFHFGSGVLMFLILRRILAWAGVEENRRTALGAFGAGLFLLHPVQTESVAYVASRSENLSVLLFLAAYGLFLYSIPRPVSWVRTGLVLLLAGAAIATKEHAAALPALLLLTDYYWNPGFSLQGIRRNWRIYTVMAAGMVAGLYFIRVQLLASGTAGFGMKGIAWYEYFFTQCRALFLYLRLFVLPFGLTADYDFPISRSPLDHGAIVGLVALVAISAAAWFYRRRYPLASFGWFAFLILMAPTSSVVPIKDPVAERRLYLSMFGLLLIALGFLRRVPGRRAVVAASACAVLLTSGALAYRRNLAWGDRVALWEDTVRKSPGKARGQFQLAYTYFEAGRCAEALPHYERAFQIQGPSYDLLVDWALAYECLNRYGDALDKLSQAARVERTAHVYSLIGMVQAKSQRWQLALDALDEAQRIDPANELPYIYRGDIRRAQGAFAAAAEQYRQALAFAPQNPIALAGLAQAEAQLGKR